MQDPAALIALASTGVAAIGIVSAAALRCWTGWLELQRLKVNTPDRAADRPRPRSDVAELKARVRKLEAIASGEY